MKGNNDVKVMFPHSPVVLSHVPAPLPPSHPAKRRGAAAVQEINVKDEHGRVIHYRVQISGDRIACWTTETEGGSLTVIELFAACVMAKGPR